MRGASCTPSASDRRRVPRLAAAALVALLLCAAAAWPDGPKSSSESEGTVVAAWSISHGTVRADPAVSVAASKQRTYSLVEAYVVNALPPDVKVLVSRLELFVSTSTAEDATDGTATENPDGATWTIALDAREGESALVGGTREDREVFDEVVVHEVGHVLSLNDSQLADDDQEAGYSADGDRFTMSALLSRFYARFWKNRYPHGSSRDGTDQAAARYEEDPGSFVTDYAATDPSEDFAESFAYFVLDPAPTGTTGKDHKIQFFYHFPDLVRDRDYLRRGLSSTR